MFPPNLAIKFAALNDINQGAYMEK